MYQGICYGGPFDGLRGQSRFPKGFLLVDKARNCCWIYEYEGGDEPPGVFKVRDEQPMRVLTEGPRNRYRAAMEPNYDVRAI